MNIKLNELYETRDMLAESMTFNRYLLQCYEAKIKRVEPLSDAFEDAVNSILYIQDRLKDFGRQQTENMFAIERETKKAIGASPRLIKK